MVGISRILEWPYVGVYQEIGDVTNLNLGLFGGSSWYLFQISCGVLPFLSKSTHMTMWKANINL